MKGNKKRNGFLDFLKLIFAIIIVIGHGDNICGTANPDRIIPLSSFGVEFFFIVSGAMLLISIEKQKQGKTLAEDTVAFMKHKIKGLLPNYYIAWIILFVILNIDNNLKIILLNFLKSTPELFFLKMSGIPTITYNGNTWYISAMLLALLLIYPLIRKNKEFFIKYIAPVTIIFGSGYITYNFNSTTVIEEWNGFMYFGLVRAIVEICIGCVTYEISKKLRDIGFAKYGKVILTTIEFILYIIVISLLFNYDYRDCCIPLILMLSVAICISLSGSSYSKNIFSNKVFNWMGIYSYSLYLGHSIAYSEFIGIFNNNFSYSHAMIIYFIASIICGLLIMYISKLYSYIWIKKKKQIKKIVLASQ